MRSFNTKFLLVVMVIMIAGAISASAQMSEGQGVRVTTSFPFTVGDKTLPAGNYRISRLGTRESAYSLVLQGEGQQMLLSTTPGSSKERFITRTEIIFENIEGQYFLAEVRAAGAETGNKIIPTHSYRSLRANNRPSKKVVLTNTGP